MLIRSGVSGRKGSCFFCSHDSRPYKQAYLLTPEPFRPPVPLLIAVQVVRLLSMAVYEKQTVTNVQNLYRTFRTRRVDHICALTLLDSYFVAEQFSCRVLENWWLSKSAERRFEGNLVAQFGHHARNRCAGIRTCIVTGDFLETSRNGITHIKTQMGNVNITPSAKPAWTKPPKRSVLPATPRSGWTHHFLHTPKPGRPGEAGGTVAVRDFSFPMCAIDWASI